MHITDTLIAYDTGFYGYSNVGTALDGLVPYVKDWQLMAVQRLSGTGVAVIDQHTLTRADGGGPGSREIRMYRADIGTLGVSSAVALSLDAGDTTRNFFVDATAVVGGSQVQIVTNDSTLTQGCYLYNYSFSGTPTKTSSHVLGADLALLPGFGELREWAGAPIISLTSSLSVVIPNFGWAQNGFLNLAWQWAEGYYLINSGTPAPTMTVVADWHTTVGPPGSPSVSTGPQWAIVDAARLTDTTFVVLGVGGVPTGGETPVVLMQMDLSGNILSSSTVPPALYVISGSGLSFGPQPQIRLYKGFDDSLWLTYVTEGPSTFPHSSMVVALNSTTGMPVGGTAAPRSVVPDDNVIICNASAISGGRWFVQSRQRIFMSQTGTADFTFPYAAPNGFATYVDPSFWGASLNHDFPTPADLTPTGSIIGIVPGWNGSSEGEVNADIYAAIFATSDTTAVCLTIDYDPGTTNYSGKTHSMFRVVTDDLYRPDPPTIVTPYNGIMVPAFVVTPLFLEFFGEVPPPVLFSSSPYHTEYAFSTVGSYTYVFNSNPPVTGSGETYLIGIGGNAFQSTGSGIFDQNSPYVITIASVNGVDQNVYTQRFETPNFFGGSLFITSEPLYTWRSGEMTWTYVQVANVRCYDLYCEILVLSGRSTGWSIGSVRMG